MLQFLFNLLSTIFLLFGSIFNQVPFPPGPKPTKPPTMTPTVEATMTGTPTSVGTVTETPTSVGTETETPTPETTMTETPTSEGTLTETPTGEVTMTETPTSEGTVTETPTSEGTVTETPTGEVTMTETPTGEVTMTETPTSEGTVTETPTAVAPSPTPGGFPFFFDNDPDDAVLQQIVAILANSRLGFADMGNNHQVFEQILTVVENNMSSFDNDADDAFLVRLAELAQREHGKTETPTPEVTPTLGPTTVPTSMSDNDNDADDGVVGTPEGESHPDMDGDRDDRNTGAGNPYPIPGQNFDNNPGPTLLPTLVMPPVLMPADPLPQQNQNFANCKPAGNMNSHQSGLFGALQNWFGGDRSSNGARSGAIVCAQR